MLEAKSRVDIAKENAPAIVTINVMQPDTSTYEATGFVVTGDGVIVTARHVIEGAMYINVTFPNGKVSGPATPIAVAKEVDVAILQIQAKNLNAVTFASSDAVRPGQEITVIGNPRRLQNTVSSGIISQVRKTPSGVLWQQISAPVSHSSSGSPVFNEEGYVVGMAFSFYPGEGNQNLNFSVPSNYIMELLTQMKHPFNLAISAIPEEPTYWQRVKNYWAGVWHKIKTQN